MRRVSSRHRGLQLEALAQVHHRHRAALVLDHPLQESGRTAAAAGGWLVPQDALRSGECRRRTPGDPPEGHELNVVGRVHGSCLRRGALPTALRSRSGTMPSGRRATREPRTAGISPAPGQRARRRRPPSASSTSRQTRRLSRSAPPPPCRPAHAARRPSEHAPRCITGMICAPQASDSWRRHGSRGRHRVYRPGLEHLDHLSSTASPRGARPRGPGGTHPLGAHLPLHPADSCRRCDPRSGRRRARGGPRRPAPRRSACRRSCCVSRSCAMPMPPASWIRRARPRRRARARSAPPRRAGAVQRRPRCGRAGSAAGRTPQHRRLAVQREPGPSGRRRRRACANLPVPRTPYRRGTACRAPPPPR